MLMKEMLTKEKKENEIFVAPDNTHHIQQDQPLYPQRFLSVLKFHPPGLASVRDESGAYHINTAGHEAYQYRYLRTFGFYELRAAVQSVDGWFHILIDGTPLYKRRYQWCGNFQNHACVVKDKAGFYFHIDINGNLLYDSQFNYAGDFKDNIAVVQNKVGRSSHIFNDGRYVHHQWFYDLDVYHKGFARAKDHRGWCHIDLNGKPIYQERYVMVEPFYNGFARVEDELGAFKIIDETGAVMTEVRSAQQTYLQKLSGEMVGYWKTQTIKSGVELNVFNHLPAEEHSLAKQTGLPLKNLTRLLRALAELQLIKKIKDRWELMPMGELLQTEHPLSLADAALHWGSEHYLSWFKLTEALKSDAEVYSSQWGETLFDWLDQDTHILQRYQNAMASYAKHDYQDIAQFLDLSGHQLVIDAGGGQGVLLKNLLIHHKNLRGILLEREQVVRQIHVDAVLRNRFSVEAFDLFAPWPKQADAILLSRVLHDWGDKEAIQILQKARDALVIGGNIYLIEMVLSDEAGDEDNSGGMLDLNMLVIAGGKERSLQDFIKLADLTALELVEIKLMSHINSVIKLKVKG